MLFLHDASLIKTLAGIRASLDLIDTQNMMLLHNATLHTSADIRIDLDLFHAPGNKMLLHNADIGRYQDRS